ncbi:MAG: hypothetical protein IPI85_14385 [Dehalococcoidia bacterium]|nr:hypothetical protein [Dehalococcoidia bacterium]
MKVVFFEDVEGTAQVGEVKEVKNGFARNFLLPRGVAGSTSKDNLQRANSLAQKEARRQQKLDGEARGVTDKLDELHRHHRGPRRRNRPPLRFGHQS